MKKNDALFVTTCQLKAEPFQHLAQTKPYYPHFHSGIVAYKSDIPIGRIAIFDNPQLRFNSKLAVTLGLFECANNQEVAFALFETAKRVAAEIGADYLLGPMDGSTWENYRFQVGDPQFHFLDNQHPAYYNQLWQAAGFEAISSYSSLLVESFKSNKQRIAEFEATMSGKGFYLDRIDLNNLERNLAEIGQLCNQSFQENFLFSPIRTQDFVAQYAQLKQFFNPEYLLFLRDALGTPVGFCFALPMDLKSGQFSNEPDTVMLKTIARHPTLAPAGTGKYLMAKCYEIAAAKGIKNALHAFMIDDAHSAEFSKNLPHQVYQRYALYGMKV